jgi:hypothetical protein
MWNGNDWVDISLLKDLVHTTNLKPVGSNGPGQTVSVLEALSPYPTG